MKIQIDSRMAFVMLATAADWYDNGCKFVEGHKTRSILRATANFFQNMVYAKFGCDELYLQRFTDVVEFNDYAVSKWQNMIDHPERKFWNCLDVDAMYILVRGLSSRPELYTRWNNEADSGVLPSNLNELKDMFFNRLLDESFKLHGHGVPYNISCCALKHARKEESDWQFELNDWKTITIVLSQLMYGSDNWFLRLLKDNIYRCHEVIHGHNMLSELRTLPIHYGFSAVQVIPVFGDDGSFNLIWRRDGTKMCKIYPDNVFWTRSDFEYAKKSWQAIESQLSDSALGQHYKRLA